MDSTTFPVLETVMCSCSAPERYPATIINVLVIGAGLGGLFAAIELWRHGHTVQVVECKDQIEGLGDFVGIAPSVTRQMKKWPGMTDIYHSIIYRSRLTIYKHDGDLLGGPFHIQEGVDHLPTPVSRPKLIEALFGYFILLGIPVRFGKKAVEYWKSVDRAKAGVVTEQGEQIEADLEIAADGVGSTSWKQIASQVDEPRSSGFSVYRVAYPTSRIYHSAMLVERHHLKEGADDICHLFLGRNAHKIENAFIFFWDHGHATELWNCCLDPSAVLNEMDKSHPEHLGHVVLHEVPTICLLMDEPIDRVQAIFDLYRTYVDHGTEAALKEFQASVVGQPVEAPPPTKNPPSSERKPHQLDFFFNNGFVVLSIYTPNFAQVRANKVSVVTVEGRDSGKIFYSELPERRRRCWAVSI
ncbi:hypothetical protein FE257_012990 [Aspergillus nanangensis]|uniref:FAD-dependent oxidoreductase 2 FAD-binding domain-containing protein n=1 Tax=Aspergillus nanangensis TaxID=2582783 RepID=A0AAD4GQC7_ASPNN|nr:hypothetical protein FE257_012990 [Aspergillus nanangensis]